MMEYSHKMKRFVIIYSGDRIVGSSQGWIQHLADLTKLYHEPLCEEIENEELLGQIKSGALPVHKMIFLTEVIYFF